MCLVASPQSPSEHQLDTTHARNAHQNPCITRHVTRLPTTHMRKELQVV